MQHAITFVIAALCILAIAYRLYGVFFVRKVLMADDKLVTPPTSWKMARTMCRPTSGSTSASTSRPSPPPARWWARSWPPSTATCRAFSGC
ncbi:hypothetical protein FT673_03920 [Aeromonas hydrophila]|nr:hypothetical protein FT673_03920 [Aeromonas hydrophila]